jgi:putative SOS response-associated peptidase YedK
MCGRFTLKSRLDVIADVFGVKVPPTLPERFNIAPSQQVLAIRKQPGSHQRELVAFTWGLVPFWADDPEIGIRTINARSETAAAKPAFRESFKSRRCLILADGFYEWQARDVKKQPYYIRLKSGQPFGVGGLWDHWEKQGESLETCTILTCDANEPMRAIHDRMPVVIPPESFQIWLDSDIHDHGMLSRLLRPFQPDEMTAYPVSTLVNNVRNDSPKLVDPLPPPEKQARLFSPDSSP